MPTPVRIVKVLAGGAVVEFSDGSTRLVMPETVEAWKRFGFNVKEGKLNAEELRIYKQVVELFPHYSGLPAEEVVPEVVPEVIEDVPDAAIVPEVTADSELREGHFGQGWLPDLGHNAKVLWQRELERARNKNKKDDTWIEILDAVSAGDVGKVTAPQVSAIADIKDLPNTIKEAQRIGSIFYKGRDGKKKLALYKHQLQNFKESVSYMEGRGSTNDQARKWMEAQISVGNEIDFEAVGGEARFYTEDYETVIDRLTLPDAGAAEVTVDLTKSDFEDATGDWTVGHDLRQRAKRKWEAGIRPTGDVQSEWDRIIAEQPERTAEVLQAELDAIDKERLALDVELGEFPSRYPDIRELTPSVDRTAPLVAGKAVPVPAMNPRDLALGTSPGWQEPYPLPRTVVEGGVGDFGDYSVRAPRVTDFQTDVTDTRMPKESVLDKIYDYGGALDLPSLKDIVDWAKTPDAVATGGVETDFDAYARAQQAQQLAAEYGDMYQEEVSDFPGITGINVAGGSETAYRERPTWEERYPLAPQEWGVDDAGLADDQWIDPHPLAINVDLGEYYKIPVEDRHKIYKPRESSWDASRSEGSAGYLDERTRRLTEKYGMDRPDEFGEIQKQAEQDAIDKAALDEWWAQAHAAPDTYGDELGEYDQYGTLSGMQEGVGMTQGIPDPLQREVDFLNLPWMGVDESTLPYDPDIRYGDRRTEVGDFRDVMVEDAVVEGEVPAFKYDGDLWYLTKQGHYAKDYKRSELVTPWQTLPSDFF